MKSLFTWWQRWRKKKPIDTDLPIHLIRGQIGEEAAAKHLEEKGCQLLVRNYESKRGEVDLIIRDEGCLVFVEVKTRTGERWGRPASAIDKKKRRNLSMAALDYLRAIGNPPVKIRFDVVEVLLTDRTVRELRHLPNCFEMEPPFRYG